jgi:uncharacterized protein YfbU (UPF0304 family)
MDRKDRFIIANQLKILEALYPDEAGSYAVQRTAFEEGYESHYSWAMEHISEDVLTEEEAKEVVDTLDMFRAIKRSYGAIPDKTGIDEYSIKFRGYDGNDPTECKLLGYARYFVVELDRFQEVLEDQNEHFDFNSHGEMRAVYQRMLEVWRAIPAGVNPGQRHGLTKDQLIAVTGAAVHPRNRG